MGVLRTLTVTQQVALLFVTLFIGAVSADRTVRVLAVATAVGNMVFCSMLGYALAKLQFPGKVNVVKPQRRQHAWIGPPVQRPGAKIGTAEVAG